MELAGVIWEAATCLFSCSKVHAAYVCKLEENLKSLQEKCDHLQNFSSDVQTKINEAEATGEMQRTSQVKDWLQQVQNLQKKPNSRCSGRANQYSCIHEDEAEEKYCVHLQSLTVGDYWEHANGSL
ncbi:hypothetical protein VNO77_05024 [Canavalia gladiata]|uniref:Uncharacterized protein n=1 Tax=Canavalia gladiata TaxID=3824 RepID=A0AAN9R9L5_CANGL